MDLIAMARALGRALQQDERYLRLAAAGKANDENDALQQDIDTFNQMRLEIGTEVMKEDKDQEKLARLDGQFKELYGRIMSTAGMIEYSQAKNELDELVSFITQIVTASASGADPDAVELSAGCGGDCQSCGGACH